MTENVTSTFWLTPETINLIHMTLANDRGREESSPSAELVKSVLLEIGAYEARTTQSQQSAQAVHSIHFPSVTLTPIYFTPQEVKYIVENVPLPIDVRETLEL